MQQCPYCHVTIAGHKTCCPLCQGPLIGSPEAETEVFPALVQPRFSRSFIVRLLAMIAISVSVICILINRAFPTRIWWSLFVTAGAGCIWLAAAVGLSNRRSALQGITWQVFLVPGLSVLWDWWTGWRGWSVDFVLPCVCTAALLTMLTLVLILHLSARSFAGYIALVCVLGTVVPGILLWLDIIRTILPSLICIGLSVLLLVGLLLFQGPVLHQEFVRRFHL